ncbi:hypothetical protein MRX96_034255 [Rhipicephalus microplus]
MEQPLQKNHARYAGTSATRNTVGGISLTGQQLLWTFGRSPPPDKATPTCPVTSESLTSEEEALKNCHNCTQQEAEPSAPNSGISAAESSWISNLARMLIFSVLLIALLVTLLLLGTK